MVVQALGQWQSRRWVIALASGTAYLLAVAIPTDLVNTPVFSREIPPNWWSWPALVFLGPDRTADFHVRRGDPLADS